MKTIADLFDAQASGTPSRVALYVDDEAVSYELLRTRANQLARYLTRCGVGPGMVVGVQMRPSADLVVALLGLSKVGATYAGLDTTWPAVRIDEALADAAAALLIVDAGHADVAPSFVEYSVPRVNVSCAAGESIDDIAVTMTPEHLMSIVYTSGSMGKPKGVMVTVRSVVNRFEWMWNAHPFEPADVGLLYRSCATVGFTWDCFGGLLKGIPTVIESAVDARNPASIVARSAERGVTHLTASAGLWDAILDEVDRRPGGWPSLRMARTTGEPLRPQMVERWRRLLPHATLLNIYGTTECSGSVAYDTTAHDAVASHVGPRGGRAASALGATRVPVGSPVPNIQVLLLEDDLRAIERGEAGEVYVSGASLARGYVGRPDLTAERFLPNPADSAHGERMFRTGDVGCWRADGQLDILGRRDLQVKVRGFRVELEEVEAALHQCPGVDAAAVRAEREDDGARLVALIVPTRDDLSLGEIRAALADRLPSYMVPAAFLIVDALPRTSARKIDRRALATLQGRALEPSASAAAPSTPSEMTLTAIWQEVLGLAHLSVDDDFFELGGHSVMGMRILSRVYDKFGVQLPFDVLFEAQTIRTLASEIDLAIARQ